MGIYLSFDGTSVVDGDGMATKLIVDENGDIIPSVRFWGVLGPEKKQILEK